ncbi:DUF2169 domain-containing protein [Neoaquamicrobium sediminum]|uniref:DUF2169 domain-containing protein n=1 Tax=Neoaquamicrobium sediminum TaxID=1849104 RepID=UPI003BABAC82
MDLALAHVEIDVLQNLDADEGLRHAGEADEGSGHGRAPLLPRRFQVKCPLSASLALGTSPPLRGGEEPKLEKCRHRGRSSSPLPKAGERCRARRARRRGGTGIMRDVPPR